MTMTAWTFSGWLGVALAALVLQDGLRGGPPETLEAQCQADYAPFVLDARARRAESQTARDSLLARLDQLDRRHRVHATDCAALLWQQRAILQSASNRHDAVVGVVTQFFQSAVHNRVTDVTARMYGLRGYSLHVLGATAESNEDLFRSASLARRVKASAAAASLTQAAEAAATVGDWTLADAFLGEARTLLLDSLAARPDLGLRLGRVLAAESGLLTRRLRTEGGGELRQALARRLLATADSAESLLSDGSTADPVQATYDQGDLALAISDGAYAEALLKDHRRARERQTRAEALLGAGVRELFPGAALDVWRNGWTIAALGGRLADAVQSARTARDGAAALGDVAMEATALEALAGFAEQAGRLDDAEAHFLAAAELRDVQWHRNRLHDWSAAEFAEAQAPYRGLARLYARSGRAVDAFVTLDDARARALRDLRAELGRRERLTPTVRATADSLLEEAETLRLAAFRDTLSAPERSAAVARLSEIQRSLAALTASGRRGRDRLNVDRLQRALGHGHQTLISYLVGERESTAFVVTDDTLVAVPLAIGADQIGRWMREAGGGWSAQTDPVVQLNPLHRLYQALIRPLAHVVPRGTSLVVVPDGPLVDLPFAMLVERPAENYEDAAFLIRRQPVSVELAAALVASPDRPNPAEEASLVAFGRTRFDTAPTRWRAAGQQPLPNLPNVATELARVGRWAGRARVALDQEATEARLAESLGRARIVHLASHAHADPTFPSLSRVLLWDDPDADDDGVLHLYELQAHRLAADLVVLSGCRTAAGPAQAGEGTLSLQYGFRAAGARASLATLWPVDDRAMADVMGAFYAALADGLPKDRALQQAQLAYLDRHDGLDASPFYWGALVLSGSIAPVPLEPPGTPVWPLAAGALALGGIAWTVARRRHVRRPPPV